MDSNFHHNNEVRDMRQSARRVGLCGVCQQLCSNQLPAIDIVETNFYQLTQWQLCGASAETILEKLREANSWGKSTYWVNPMHMRVMVDKQVDVWFINNPRFNGSNINDWLAEYYFVDSVVAEGLYINEIFEDKYGSYFCSRNHILTFVRTRIGYVFLGVYQVCYNCADGKTVTNVYRLVDRTFPILNKRLQRKAEN